MFKDTEVGGGNASEAGYKTRHVHSQSFVQQAKE